LIHLGSQEFIDFLGFGLIHSHGAEEVLRTKVEASKSFFSKTKNYSKQISNKFKEKKADSTF
jgi:hypothetical protein